MFELRHHRDDALSTIVPAADNTLRSNGSSSRRTVGDGSHNSGSSNSSSASWRKRGEQLRLALLENDERMGGQAFLLSSSCPIHRYYHVADKVRSGCSCLMARSDLFQSLAILWKLPSYFRPLILLCRFWINFCTIRLIVPTSSWKRIPWDTDWSSSFPTSYQHTTTTFPKRRKKMTLGTAVSSN
jgi:hypothetical protein